MISHPVRVPFLLGLTLLLPGAPVSRAATALSVTQAGPEGEIARLEEANEIRIQFSDAMVALSAAAGVASPSFVRIDPPIRGRFHWSGTKLLIFTPDITSPLPYGTKYTVTVDAAAASVDGRRLGSPYVFGFTTPTVRLVRAEYYRKTQRFDSPAILIFNFNQPISPEALIRHLHVRYEQHAWTPPTFQDEMIRRMASTDPGAYIDFVEKLGATARAAASMAAVPFTIASDWDKNRYRPEPNLLVLETREPPPAESWVRADFDESLPGLAGRETPGSIQSYTFKMAPALFVTGLSCMYRCSSDDYTAISFAGAVRSVDVASHATVIDVTDPNAEVTLPRRAAGAEEREEPWFEQDAERSFFSLDWLGVAIKPARTYVVKVDKNLEAPDGQTLGYNWYGQVAFIHERAFASFGTGHGVWEVSGGPQLPFYARNLTSVRQWLAPIGIEDLVPAIMRFWGHVIKPDGTVKYVGGEELPGSVEPTIRDLQPIPDEIQSFGLALSPVLSPAGTGIVWAALAPEEAIQDAASIQQEAYGSLIQVTNLGISVKDSPANTLIMVTRLDDGAPVEGADVAIRTLDNKVFWRGVTDAKGVAMAPSTDMRLRTKLDSWEIPWTLAFVVTARKGDDLAYLCSDWNEGVQTGDFGYAYSTDEAKPVLRGSVFADRGVYKLGEEVHVKAILRHDTAGGMKLLPAGGTITVVVTDTNGKEIDRRQEVLSEWSSADWILKLPQNGALGGYSVQVWLGKEEASSVYGEFLVAAYRKPDFRVDATIGGADDVAGATLKGVVSGRYLFGAAMAGRPVAISYSKQWLNDVPSAVRERFPAERFAFLREAWESGGRPPEGAIFQKELTLGPDGTASLELGTDLAAGQPYSYTIEGEVTDVSRQALAGRASMAVHPAPWYIGVKRPGYLIESQGGLKTEVVAVSPRGDAVAGVPVEATLKQVQWNSVRRAEGHGFYTWETKRVEIEKWTGQITTGNAPVPLAIPLDGGGYFILALEATDGEGRSTITTTDFYAIGSGYTAWERYDHNRIDLVPERKTYRPGETARIMVKSPWESATALLTVEREGIRSHRELQLTSSQQTLEVPITESDIPNIYVSVLLVKGRTSSTIEKDGSDPGKPAFRVGYTQLSVDNGLKRLSVELATNKEEFRPAEEATIAVQVKDRDGKPSASEVTLWAVDYGVLSLTGYKTPDVLPSVYVEKALQVLTSDSRQRIVSRRVITPKGADEGGGGGYEEGPENKVRKDFRVLAFWLGSAATDAQGRLHVTQKLPDALTTYRIMAVVNDKAHRFGWAQREIRLSKPVQLRPAFPRFLTMGDKAHFGAVVHSLLKQGGTALVTMKSLNPEILAVTGVATKTAEIGANGVAEVRFDLDAKAVGEAGIVMSTKLLGEGDSFEASLPVRLVQTPETVAAYGTAVPGASEKLVLPANPVAGVGGLHVELASTAMVGLGEGARYVIEYPYGCAEQKASAALALMLSADLGGAFQVPEIRPDEMRRIVQETLDEIETFQCEGGFSFWKGSCAHGSPYLTSYVLYVMQRAVTLGYKVSPQALSGARDYLENELNQTEKPEERLLMGYLAWQAFAVKVMAEGGKNVDSHITRLYELRARMPVFGLCHLWDAMAARGSSGRRIDDVKRRVMNAILPEGGSAHAEENQDPYLLWFWNTTARSSAIALGSLVRNGGDPPTITALVRWLMQSQKEGRWDNTQENAWAMSSLIDYYRKYEAEVPDFTAIVSLGARSLMKETFKGRDTKARIGGQPMETLLAGGAPGQSLPMTFERQGTGTLFYTARLTYASADPIREPLDAGFKVERSYARQGGGESATSFNAGDLVEVTLTFTLPKERRWVAVTDPVPAGLEPVESWFATTRQDLANSVNEWSTGGSWSEWWERGGFDHVERHDDRVLLFATRLSEGRHTFKYVCRATTVGTFRAAPARAEEMYEPEVLGRTAETAVEVKR